MSNSIPPEIKTKVTEKAYELYQFSKTHPKQTDYNEDDVTDKQQDSFVLGAEFAYSLAIPLATGGEEKKYSYTKKELENIWQAGYNNCHNPFKYDNKKQYIKSILP